MQIIAHRGASGLEPENTIRSLKKAQDDGADMVEFDVRLSKDGEIVLSHDRSLKRMFGVNKLVKNLTLKELKEISSEIPTLREVLESLSIPINVHIKTYGMEKKVMDALQNFSSEVLISSTRPWVLKKIRALDEKVKLGLVIGKGELQLLPIINFWTRNLNLYSIHPKVVLVSFLTIDLLKSFGKKIFVWTINSRSEYQKMQELGVDGIITDHSNLFR